MAHAPENTIRAFRLALDLGADGFELDVHRSKDGHLVVIHDGTVDKTTNGTGAVAEMTLAELRSLNAGDGERIVTLGEVFDAFPTAYVYVELKAEDTETPTADLIRQKGAVERVIVGSFDPGKVARVKDYAPEIETSLLIGEWDVDFVALARDAKADCIHFCWRHHPSPHTLLTDGVMRRAEDAGLKVVLWNEERPDEIWKLVQKPIYGICSNEPELFANI
jgi:glycerophosphoryl diester phosphodiesterase